MPKSKKRRSLKTPRANAFKLQNGRCFYCGYPMWNERPDDFMQIHGISKRCLRLFRCTAEHLIAHSNGGSSSQHNLVAACAFCNQERHRRPKVPSPESYRSLVRSRVQLGRWHTQLFVRQTPGLR